MGVGFGNPFMQLRNHPHLVLAVPYGRQREVLLVHLSTGNQQ